VPTLHQQVRDAADRKPICAVVRTDNDDEALRQARLFIKGGLELIEVTFSVPNATDIVRQLLSERGDAAHFVGMGTVTTPKRCKAAVKAGSEFIVAPNICKKVAKIARKNDLYFMLGALSATEIVQADRLGGDIVKVYPLPPVGGPHYLSVVRQPLGDIKMLAGGGFDIEEIPAYRAAGASMFGIGGPLLGANDEESLARIARAVQLATGGSAGDPS
jgi:2-dehydro-3-deoxyphosphogluconate aldolase/(4S)-4-hydroxy-2-oxoglutarate aldolase